MVFIILANTVNAMGVIAPLWLRFLILPFSIAYVVVVFQYVHELKRIKCKCSESLTRTILEIVNYINIAIVIWFFVSLLMVGLLRTM
jgi:hypothetical protein